jgi:plasmid stabilization system protein ParE
MVQEIVWSAEARKNLEEIKKHIEKDSLFYAERLVRQIFETTTILYNHAEFGKPVMNYGEITLRRLLHKSYRIIYFIKNGTAFIVTVFHQARQFPDLLDIDNLFQ